MKPGYLGLAESLECTDLTNLGQKRVFFGTVLELFGPNIVDDSQAHNHRLKMIGLLKRRDEIREEYELLVGSSKVLR